MLSLVWWWSASGVFQGGPALERHTRSAAGLLVTVQVILLLYWLLVLIQKAEALAEQLPFTCANNDRMILRRGRRRISPEPTLNALQE